MFLETFFAQGHLIFKGLRNNNNQLNSQLLEIC